jgi:hypothetical protein
VSTTPESYLGDRVGDDVVVYRAFAQSSFRDRKRNRVEYYAYLAREQDLKNGLSVGLTPAAAVKHLASNEGYGHITVQDIRAVGNGVDVRYDTRDPEHAYICNLPYQKKSDQDREQARFIAGQLAKKSVCDTCDSYPPAAADTTIG